MDMSTDMENEYDFSGAKRGRFYRPEQPKHYVVTYDHMPKSGTFEVFRDEAGSYRVRLKTASGSVVMISNAYDSQAQAIRSVEELKESVVGAKTVVSG